MNAREALTLLTHAALVDPRMKRNDPNEWADMAEAWAVVLGDVPLTEAAEALVRVQRSRRGADAPILPGDILDEVGGVVAPNELPDRTDDLGRARALGSIGVTEEEYQQRRHDSAWIASLVARLADHREVQA